MQHHFATLTTELPEYTRHAHSAVRGAIDLRQRTFVMLKPDAVRRRLVGEIIARIERTGLRIVAMRAIQATAELAGRQYGREIAQKYGQQVRQWLIDYICDGICIVMVWEGDNCVQAVRAIAGDDPSPSQCHPGTIRRDLATDSQQLATENNRAIHNLIHTADSVESADREIDIWFGEQLKNV